MKTENEYLAEVIEALKELTDQATQAAHWVPHVLLLGAIERANEVLAKDPRKS